MKGYTEGKTYDPEPKLYNDHFQNYKRYSVPKAQLIIADIPYNVGKNAYGSSPSWYVDGDNKNGESELANKEFFDTDKDFRITEFLHFCSTMLIKEPKETGKAPCMIVFCAFEQQFELIEKAKKYGLMRYINLAFRKNFSPQVLKANMRPVGNMEHAILLYRDKLPKFNNNGKMIFTCMDWIKDNDTPKIHPTQKPVKVLENLIQIFTDEGDVVIDPCAGSGSTLLAAGNLKRKVHGFEIKKDFFKAASELLRERNVKRSEIETLGYAKTEIEKTGPTLFDVA
jgi:site-specific DNA-methyltransferase (adenine-specific)